MTTAHPFTIRIPWPGKPKPRPRVDATATHNPSDYTQWKADIIELLAYQKHTVEGYCELDMEFTEKEVIVRVIPINYDYQRAKHVRADIDNLAGGIMDAFQDAGVIDNDSKVVSLTARIRNRKGDIV